MKQFFIRLLAVVALLCILSGCGPAPAPTEPLPPATDPTEAVPVPTDPTEPAYTPDLTEHVTLQLSVLADTGSFLRFTDPAEGAPFVYEAANGQTYRAGDFKPVWETLQQRLNFTIADVVPEGAQTVAQAYDVWKEAGFAGVDILTVPAEQVLQAGITSDAFLDLSQYMDKLPHFRQFLAENPVVRASVTAADGGIYYAPHLDGYDDIQHMLMLRTGWVEKLLDGEDTVYDTQWEVETYYEPYLPVKLETTLLAMKSDGSGLQTVQMKCRRNIITVQNNLPLKNGETLTKSLKHYIDITYPGVFAKRSDLFIGQDACYNADELVALMRCVLANRKLLSGQEAQAVVPFFPRSHQTSRVQQLLSLAEIWGVRGLESRNGYLYLDNNGRLLDARFSEDMMDALERLNALYKEGLILQDFDTDAATAALPGQEHRDRLLEANLGFATYDYCQTTTAYNLTSQVKDFCICPVLPPVADWDGTGRYTRFTASWRSVRADGWGITASVAQDAQKLDRALALVDYLFSQEGSSLMTYGPEAWQDGTVMYDGREVPQLSAAARKELRLLAEGNYTDYYRNWVGATFPVGYVKEQGMEFQTMDKAGEAGLVRLLNACRMGAMTHLTPFKGQAASNQDMLVPTVFALNSQELTLLEENCKQLQEAFSDGTDPDSQLLFADYIKGGFEADGGKGKKLLSKDELRQYLFHELKGDVYLLCYQSAYQRMMAQDRTAAAS